LTARRARDLAPPIQQSLVYPRPETIDFIGISDAHFNNSGGAPLLSQKMNQL
jgi:Cft2 family RNA processing exonuclease